MKINVKFSDVSEKEIISVDGTGKCHCFTQTFIKIYKTAFKKKFNKEFDGMCVVDARNNKDKHSNDDKAVHGAHIKLSGQGKNSVLVIPTCQNHNKRKIQNHTLKKAAQGLWIQCCCFNSNGRGCECENCDFDDEDYCCNCLNNNLTCNCIQIE
eukprot:gene1788-930_t